MDGKAEEELLKDTKSITTTTTTTTAATDSSLGQSSPTLERRPLRVTLSTSCSDQTATSTDSPRVLEEIKRRREAARLRKKELLSGQNSRSVDLKVSTIRQHYYPEGGYGWVILAAASLVFALTTGLQLSFGVMSLELRRQAFAADMDADTSLMHSIWMGSLSYSVSLIVAPGVVAFCRRKSSRLTGIFGGLAASLGLLFASFALQFHQVFVSYAIFMALGIGAARQVANLMVGQYFKRRREMVEIALMASQGLGVTAMAPVLHFGVRALGWRRGLQTLALIMFSSFLLGTLYRSASLYHPQRRAILHLKTQRRKIREKQPSQDKPPFFDFSTLKIRSLRTIMLAMALASTGFLSPTFYLGDFCAKAATELEARRQQFINDANRTFEAGLVSTEAFPLEPYDKQTLHLHLLVGLSTAAGVAISGLLVARPSSECRISRKYLCQTTLLVMGLLMATSGAFEGSACGGPHSALLLLYAGFFGGLSYAIKMLVFERVRARFFNRAWAFVEWAQAIPILVGTPAAGYINAKADVPGNSSNSQFFTAACCVAASFVLCLVPIHEKKKNLSLRGHKICSPQGSAAYAKDTMDGVQPINSNTSDGVPRMDSAVFNAAAVDSECDRCGQRFTLLVNDVPTEAATNSASMAGVVQAVREDEAPPAKRKRPTDVLITDQEEDDDEDDDLDDDLVALSRCLPKHELGTFFSEDLPFDCSVPGCRSGVDIEAEAEGDCEDNCDKVEKNCTTKFVRPTVGVRTFSKRPLFATVTEEATVN